MVPGDKRSWRFTWAYIGLLADAVPEFISQRRRWLNGAFFAAVYSLIHFRQIWRTDHTVTRKILLHIEFVYQFVSLVFTFFSLVSTMFQNNSLKPSMMLCPRAVTEG